MEAHFIAVLVDGCCRGRCGVRGPVLGCVRVEGAGVRVRGAGEVNHGPGEVARDIGAMCAKGRPGKHSDSIIVLMGSVKGPSASLQGRDAHVYSLRDE